jgi:hypothetical protein
VKTRPMLGHSQNHLAVAGGYVVDTVQSFALKVGFAQKVRKADLLRATSVFSVSLWLMNSR